MNGLCGCGCGQPTAIASKSDVRTGAVRGQPMRYLRGHNNARDAAPTPIRRAAPVDAAGYAEQLRHALELFIGAVHDEGPAERRAALSAALRLTPPAGVDPVEALAVVLAAQIDPDTTGEQRLGWTRRFATPDDSPRRAPAPRKESAA